MIIVDEDNTWPHGYRFEMPTGVLVDFETFQSCSEWVGEVGVWKDGKKLGSSGNWMVIHPAS
jgi:hypothetical protein